MSGFHRPPSPGEAGRPKWMAPFIKLELFVETSSTADSWTSKLTGRKTHPTSIPLVGRDVKYNAMASLDLIRRQDTRNWLGFENDCKNEAEKAEHLKFTETKVL